MRTLTTNCVAAVAHGLSIGLTIICQLVGLLIADTDADCVVAVGVNVAALAAIWLAEHSWLLDETESSGRQKHYPRHTGFN